MLYFSWVIERNSEKGFKEDKPIMDSLKYTFHGKEYIA